MRFLSFFRTPKHQQFHIETRYYDPVKEELEERKRKIRQQMMRDDQSREETYVSKINFKKRPSKQAPSSMMLQMGIAIILVALTFGWLEFGNKIFEYLLYVAVPAYILYRLRKSGKRK